MPYRLFGDAMLLSSSSFNLVLLSLTVIKDTHRENTSSNKTQALTKSMNLNNRIVGTFHQLLGRGYHAEIKFSKEN